MDVRELGIIELDETPPTLDLTPGAIEALAETLRQYHAEFAPLYYRQEQAHWGYKYLQGLMLPLERKAMEPLALALAGGNVQAMHQCIGPGQWQDEAVWSQPWHGGERDAGGHRRRLHCRELGGCHARGACGRGRPPVVWPCGQSRPLAVGGVRGVCQPQGLYAARPAAVSARRVV